jgi:hypothetical protein
MRVRLLNKFGEVMDIHNDYAFTLRVTSIYWALKINGILKKYKMQNRAILVAEDRCSIKVN